MHSYAMALLTTVVFVSDYWGVINDMMTLLRPGNAFNYDLRTQII